MLGRTKNVTIAEMASRLGVSTATVAKALNGKGKISPAMVEKVNSLAREMKYIPNMAARSLRTNNRDAVGVLITADVVNPWYSQLVSHLEEELSQCGLTMLLALGKNNPDKARHALRNFVSGRVGGILVGPILRMPHMEILKETLERNLPVVIFNNLENLPVNSVGIDQAAGAESAVEHLIALGHRRIMYFGALDTDSRNPAGTRYSGYMATIERHGLKPEFLFAVKTSERRTGFELANQLLKNSGKLPDALFCHNDDLALGAMMALQQAKLRIPDDISLIGFDDIAESSFSVPGLTTVGGVMHKLATALVGTLRQAIDTNREPIRISIVPQLITRGSTTSRGSTTNKGEAK